MSQENTAAPDFARLLTPTVTTRSLDDVVEKLRAILISGQVRPDQKLPSERALAAILQVSRTTVREALRTLEAQGLIEIKLGGSGGAFFRSPDPKTLGSALAMLLMFESISEDDLHEYRTDFEQENAELAAQRASEAERDELRELRERAVALRDARVADPLSIWPAVERLDLSVHERLPVLSRNAVRVAISRGIHDALQRSFDRVQPRPESPQQLAAEVVELLDLVIAGDGPAARATMAEHLRRWRS